MSWTKILALLPLIRQLAEMVDAETIREVVAALRAGDGWRVAELILRALVGSPKVATAAPGQLTALPDDVAAELDRLEAEARAAGPAA